MYVVSRGMQPTGTCALGSPRNIWVVCKAESDATASWRLPGVPGRGFRVAGLAYARSEVEKGGQEGGREGEEGGTGRGMDESKPESDGVASGWLPSGPRSGVRRPVLVGQEVEEFRGICFTTKAAKLFLLCQNVEDR